MSKKQDSCPHCNKRTTDSRHHRGLCRRQMRKTTGKNKK